MARKIVNDFYFRKWYLILDFQRNKNFTYWFIQFCQGGLKLSKKRQS